MKESLPLRSLVNDVREFYRQNLITSKFFGEGDKFEEIIESGGSYSIVAPYGGSC